ncbi:hypothetical protein EJ05DRAFT_491095 [Pseudovirgaria hyperparasitica]|uniref:Phosphatidylserine decarboxylase proenzyme 2 n=1 Tax=Pseudovirgaria hyperparasitica TaxID=470096 RepID=A0A6A6WKR9_9PEZI|nr:uncharacterized protein EJ05DRAFT_491095 [Pseudovirgaria hyperparasitica]KAF2762800.1 hypothetical protein EJ05DRAFT_491095 [Pseudovirgaria hyperparasitica]
MPRPTLASRISLPNRLKSFNGSTASNPPSGPSSRSQSPKARMADIKHTGLVLRTTVIKARDLAAKDKSGTSDPYLVLTLGDAKEATPVISKTLNPEWNQTFDLPIVGVQSLLLEAVCWDKDRFGKDYMGEFDISLEEIFSSEATIAEVHERTRPFTQKWYKLESRKTGKKKSVVTGEVLIQFTLVDTQNPSSSAAQTLEKFRSFIIMSPGDEEEDSLDRMSSLGERDEDKEDSSSEIDDDKKEDVEKRKRRLRMRNLKRKATLRGYEFSDKSEVAGVLFLEVVKITDLPPEKNMTRTSFDMDPFVVTSLGRKTYRTRVIRHNLNPVFEEKLVFQVLKHEKTYSLNFTVIDKDKFSGNDFIGKADFPMEKALSVSPEADQSTGLYKLPQPSDSPPLNAENKKSRFRLPISRSTSANSLYKLGKAPLKSQNLSNALPSDQVATASATSTSSSLSVPQVAPSSDTTVGNSGIPAINVSPQAADDTELRSFTIPIEMKNKDKWESKHSPVLYIRAKYLPYLALRQQFWRAMLKQYDADDSGMIDKIELTTMLDNLGSTLHESTIDGFFSRFAGQDGPEGPQMTFDQAVICLEDQLNKTREPTAHSLSSSMMRSLTASSSTDADDTPGTLTPSGTQTPLNNRSTTSVIPAIEQPPLGTPGEEGAHLSRDDLADDKGEEHVIEIRECPICHQPRLNKKSDADIITHVATCASQDWRQVNNIVMAGFVTSSQAQRKWYSKVVSKITYGGYKLGANSANILVQDRITGQINEERMGVYVRLGIRLLYKGFKSSTMEKNRIRKLLKSLSIKQGKKYDDPASTAQIQGFINFHQLDMSEVLLPTEQFKSFNEFFYRALKPNARPCSAPDDPQVIVSPADCRSVVFNTLEIAQNIWVKGREFTVERLLGNAYPDDVKRFQGGALGIFRLAPQDYHRFHIPVDGVMDEPKLIEGEYYTVNPMAIRSALDVYGENVRVCVPIDSVTHGRVMVICVGAMMVGSTVITRKAGEKVSRAEELGYFKFGGSTILLLFEPGQMVWDEDMVENSNGALETLIRVGMSVGHSPERAPHTPDMRKANPTNEEKQEAKRRIEGSLAPEANPSSGIGIVN